MVKLNFYTQFKVDFKGKLGTHRFRILSVCTYTFRAVTDNSNFTVNRNFKVSPSGRSSSAASAICTDVFNNDCVLLTDITRPFKPK
jgi:hypothetical protein